MEWDKFWSMNKKKYEQGAHRYMGVFKETCVELHIENAPEGNVVSIPVALHPKVSPVHQPTGIQHYARHYFKARFMRTNKDRVRGGGEGGKGVHSVFAWP